MHPFPTSRATTYYRLVGAMFIGLVCILIAAGLQPYVPVEYLMRDPAALSSQPAHFGLFSNIGILLWTASAVVCLFSAAVLKALQASSRSIAFLVAFGSLSALLGLDDLFLLHERTFPFLFQISQDHVLVGYGVIFLLMLVQFRKTLLREQPLILGASLLFLSISTLIDLTPRWLLKRLLTLFTVDSRGLSYLLEDGAKLLGIFIWLTYFARLALVSVTQANNHPETSHPETGQDVHTQPLTQTISYSQAGASPVSSQLSDRRTKS